MYVWYIKLIKSEIGIYIISWVFNFNVYGDGEMGYFVLVMFKCD